MTPNDVEAIRQLVDIMREKCLTHLSLQGIALTMDPRGFNTQPVQTMVIPPHEIPPEARDLFRDLTDEELLLGPAVASLPEG